MWSCLYYHSLLICKSQDFHLLLYLNEVLCINFVFTVMTEQIKERIEGKLLLSANGECLEFQGRPNKGGYGVICVTLPPENEKKTYLVHRLYYCLCKNIEIVDLGDNHCSHLCNNKLCAKIEHLSIEAGYVNNSRKNCFFRRQCSGHPGHANCIFYD